MFESIQYHFWFVLQFFPCFGDPFGKKILVQEDEVQEDEELEEVEHNEEELKKKKWPETFRQTVIASRMRNVEKWRNRKDQTLSVTNWCFQERICARTMYNWIEEYPKYKNLSFSHKTRIRRRYQQKGKYHQQKMKLNKRFAERRANNHRVTGRWI